MKYYPLVSFFLIFIQTNLSIGQSRPNTPPGMLQMQHRIDSIHRLDSLDPRPLNDVDYNKVSHQEWEKIIDEIVSMEKNDQSLRQEGWTSKQIINKQTNIDSLNTIRLIEIIKKYGYPNSVRLRKKASATLILFHSPPSFFNVLDNLLSEECKKGNITREENEILHWHFKGRPGQTFTVIPN